MTPDAYALAYQKSPIFFVGGIAENLPLGILPLIGVTQGFDAARGILTGTIATKLTDFFADFEPAPGATLQNNQIGSYPFANQTVAANAIIMQPLAISMLMKCPPRLEGAMVSRHLTVTALKKTMDNHAMRGGTYSILTPSYLYQGCIMTTMQDVTDANNKAKQTVWQMNFEQPLTNEMEALSIQGKLMSKISGGLPSDTSWSGTFSGFNPFA